MKNKTKIGVIFAIHSISSEDFNALMHPWIEFSKNEKYEIVKTAVSCTFLENRLMFPELIEQNKSTIELINRSQLFDFVYSDEDIPLKEYTKEEINNEDNPLLESNVRNKALNFLKEKNIDILCLWDGDEFATASQLEDIFSHVIANKYYTWYSISYKNFVFDMETHLVDPFTPPRIFRIDSFGNRLDRFYLDNHAYYLSREGNRVPIQALSHKVIPKEVAWIKHVTWLSNERSKKKIQYQKAHHGRYGDGCGFDWDEINDKLIFSVDYHAKRGIMVPLVQKLT